MDLADMILYHGSASDSVVPTFGLGNDHHDYGRGFYLTDDLDLAREWAEVPLQFLKTAYAGLHDLDLNLAVAKVAGR